MNHSDLIAIDVHTHAEVSCRQAEDEYAEEFSRGMKKYFKSGQFPTIAETISYYRERKIGLIMFTVDTEFEIGRRRIPNEEICMTEKPRPADCKKNQARTPVNPLWRHGCPPAVPVA